MAQVGVSISLPKSSISLPSDPYRYGEIAKRLITPTGEITPIPYRLIQAWASNPSKEALTLRQGLEGRGIRLEPASYETLAKDVFGSLTSKESLRFLVSTQAPSTLIGRARSGLAHSLIRSTVWTGIWNKRDTSQA